MPVCNAAGLHLVAAHRASKGCAEGRLGLSIFSGLLILFPSHARGRLLQCLDRTWTPYASSVRTISSSDRADAAFTRQLQDGADQGMSVDTIAIVASVLVGAAGYLVQAYTARRAEQSTAAQAQELHLHEQTRQREHEQMLSQIARTDRWLDDCAHIDALILSCCVGLPACGRD